MGDKSCVIIYGLDEFASAVGRMLLLSGYAVAMHAAVPPETLRRKMAFSDAWYDGQATLEDVEARRVGRDADLLTGLRSSMFIPVLREPFAAIARWPWDVVIDARGLPAGGGRMGIDAELVIVLGPGAVAGVDCDLVIETGGFDPGAVLRSGRATSKSETETCEHPVVAPTAGLFHADAAIGDHVPAGTVLGYVGSAPVAAAITGRVRGLARSDRVVEAGATVAEIAADADAPVDRIDRRHKLVARALAFTLEMELEGQAMNVWNRRPGSGEDT